jgi:MFS family permease
VTSSRRASGPVIGGFLAGQDELLGISGWRWVFLVNVPVGAGALALVMRSLHLPHQRRDHQIDWPGALALVVGLTPLLLLAEQGRDWGWSSPLSVTAMAVGVLGLVGFVLAERRYGDDALLPLRLFRGRTFGLGSLLNFMLGMGMFGGLAALPLYLQIVKGASPTEAGLLLLPLTAGIMAGSVFSGQAIARTGRYKRFPVAGAAMLVVAMGLLAQVAVDTPLWQTLSIATLFGLGLGFNMQPLVLAVQNAVPPRDMGVATSSATFFRQMGGTLGTAVFLSVLFSTVGEKILAAFRADAATSAFQQAVRDPQVLAEPANVSVIEALRTSGTLPAGSLDDTSFLSQLDPRIARPFLEGFAGSMSLVFTVAAGILVLAFVVVLFLPEEPLRSVSGIQAREQEAAETAAAAASVSAPSSQMVDGDTLDESAQARR